MRFDRERYNHFLQNAQLDDGFEKLTKKFGIGYLNYLAISYAGKDDMPDAQWQAINGNVPDSFMPKVKSMALRERAKYV